jgi:ATP-dependent Clp protease ATP-binding subunit ClpX
MFDIPRSDEQREVIITEKCITEGAQPEVRPIK